jgi:hypothetical protein
VGILISIATLFYGALESLITYMLAREYNSNFRYVQAFGMTYFVSFYRTASLGSGAGVAALVYLNGCGVKTSEGCGMYMVQYAIHKVSLTLLAVILYLFNMSYMKQNFAQYNVYLLIGIGLNVIITIILVLFACASWFHRLLYKLMDLVNFKGKFTKQFQKVREQCDIMEEAARKLLKSKRKILLMVLLNMMKFSCWFIIPYITMRNATNISAAHSLTIAAVSVMLAAVIPTPAGIGSTEFMFIEMFSVVAGQEVAGAASLLYRFATFVLPFILGIVPVLGFKKLKQLSTIN